MQMSFVSVLMSIQEMLYSKEILLLISKDWANICLSYAEACFPG